MRFWGVRFQDVRFHGMGVTVHWCGMGLRHIC